MNAGNLAYDFSRFEESAVRKENITEKKAEIRMVKQKRERRSPVKSLAVLMTIMLMAGTLIYNQVVLTEVNDKQYRLNKEITSLDNEITRKQTKLDSKLSLLNVEDYAVNVLGYVKIDQAKAKYINLSKENKIEIKNPEPKNIFEKLVDTISGFWNS